MSLEAAEIAPRSLALTVIPVVAEGEDTPPFWMILEVPLGRVRAVTAPATAAAVVMPASQRADSGDRSP